MKEGEQSAIKAAVAGDLIPSTDSIEGSDFHYNMFESMITQRDLYDESLQPTDQFRNKMFKAQLIKDISMAHVVNKLLKSEAESNYLVIAGKGHCQHFCGVPERILEMNPQLKEKSLLVVGHESCESLDLEKGLEFVQKNLALV